MKIILLVFIGIFTSLGWHFNYIKNTNERKVLANQFYSQHNLPRALESYYALVYHYQLKEESVLLNMANCYFELGNIEASRKIYQTLSKSQTIKINAQANTQLGIIQALSGKKQIALRYFKIALIADPSHDVARYNFELITKKNPRKAHNNKVRARIKKNQESDTEAEMESEDNSSEEGDETQDIKNQPESKNNAANAERDENSDNSANKLATKTNHATDANLAKALLLLENMRQQELNYLQQKSFQKHKKKTHNKNDW